jgi:exodeoxyribonuclease-5
VQVFLLDFIEMKRSEDQEAAWLKFTKWLATGGKEFRLGGLAGTGKTTMIKAIRQQMGNCQVVTPSAKAAEVLNKKGVPAATSHSIFCRFDGEQLDQNGKLNPVFSDKKTDVDFLIVDEASMVTKEMQERILRYSNRVVWVGDYGQLPPVETSLSGKKLLTEDNLDAKLDQIHRTDNDDILRFAMFLRNGGDPTDFEPETGAVMIHLIHPNPMIMANEITRKDLWPVICYTNRMVDVMNTCFRQVYEIEKQIEPGLKIVCTRNSYKFPVVNGQMFTVRKNTGNLITTECGLTFPVTTDRKNKHDVQIMDGYAITCHKSQGSEWDRIAVIEDMAASAEWRYTAATRAKKTIIYYARG